MMQRQKKPTVKKSKIATEQYAQTLKLIKEYRKCHPLARMTLKKKKGRAA